MTKKNRSEQYYFTDKGKIKRKNKEQIAFTKGEEFSKIAQHLKQVSELSMEVLGNGGKECFEAMKKYYDRGYKKLVDMERKYYKEWHK